MRQDSPRPEALEQRQADDQADARESPPQPRQQLVDRLSQLGRQESLKGHTRWAKLSEELKGRPAEVAQWLAWAANTGHVPPQQVARINGATSEQLADALIEAVKEGIDQATAADFLKRRFPA